METSSHPVAPLCQRMLEDMRMRKLAPKTREAYIRAVSRFAKYLGRSPDTVAAENFRLYQLHSGLSCRPLTSILVYLGASHLLSVGVSFAGIK